MNIHMSTPSFIPSHFTCRDVSNDELLIPTLAAPPLCFKWKVAKMVPCGSLFSSAHRLPPEINRPPKPYLFKGKPYLFCHQTTDIKPRLLVCSVTSTASSTSSSTNTPSVGGGAVRKRINRHRKLNPGEKDGIVEEMRFVAMRLRTPATSASEVDEGADESAASTTATWHPTVEGFLRYLVDSKLVFDTLERIVEDSTDVIYVYFRRTGLERSSSLDRDLEWFGRQGHAIPHPSSPGISYASYLADLAEKSAPSFLCHFYNIYFAHVNGGCEISKQVCEKLLIERKLEFCNWDGDAHRLLRNVRENLNKLGEHWPRIEKNKCLKEAAKSFKQSGQIVRLIIL